jgi:WD40-like Beta Propeller Repeat
MKLSKRLFWLVTVIVGALFIIGCQTENFENTQQLDRKPCIDPDYAGVTLPPNIAPMNFIIKEDGDSYKITITNSFDDYQLSITTSDGIVRFPKKSWRKLLENSKGGKIKIQVSSLKKDEKYLKKYKPIFMYVANDSIDSYLIYRLFFPGYSHWAKIKIVQRSLENFKEESLIENQLLDKNCMNCHSFDQNNPDRFLLHIRGSKGGTYFVEDDMITRRELKTKDIPGGTTYPSWHPNGRYVAFSSNKVKQALYGLPKKDHEVFDLISSLVLYDRKNNEMLNIKEEDTLTHMQTFPSWSPDGKYLYFCRTNLSEKKINLENIKNIHYDLARKAFDPESRSFGKTEIVFNATEINKSASFPIISPNGQYLVFTLQDYGTFPAWHKEADLYLLNLQNRKYTKMSINSNEAESYHNWSSNGRWLVFSSKRRDGRSARAYFAYFESPDNIGKPFVLPQKDPVLYNRMLRSFNLPELVTGRISIGPRDFERAAKKKSIKAKPGDSSQTLPEWIDSKANESASKTEHGVYK